MNAGRSQNPSSTEHGVARRTVGKCVRAKGASGKWGRKVDGEGRTEAEMEIEALPVVFHVQRAFVRVRDRI